MQVCTSLQTDNHASTPLLSFLQAGCPSCRPNNSVKALKATTHLMWLKWKKYTQTCARLTAPSSGTTRVSQYQKGKTKLDFTEARDSEWQWHQLGHMQVCTSLQTDNHASTTPLSFLQAGCLSRRPKNSVKALKAKIWQLKANVSKSTTTVEQCYLAEQSAAAVRGPSGAVYHVDGPAAAT